MKRKNAFFKALDEAPSQEQAQESLNQSQQFAKEKQAQPKLKREKITIYLEETQSFKLEDIVLKYKKQNRRKINRIEIIRRLLDRIPSDEIISRIG